MDCCDNDGADQSDCALLISSEVLVLVVDIAPRLQLRTDLGQCVKQATVGSYLT